jgi:hypothetical protein
MSSVVVDENLQVLQRPRYLEISPYHAVSVGKMHGNDRNDRSKNTDQSDMGRQAFVLSLGPNHYALGDRSCPPV